MQFSYTFSQRHNTDLLYSHGHHLAPGGNMRRDPDELLALSGERLPRIDGCVTGASGATIRMRQIVGQSGRLLPVRTFFSGQCSHNWCQVSEWSLLSYSKRKHCCIQYLFYCTNTPSTLWTSIVIQLIFNYIHKCVHAKMNRFVITLKPHTLCVYTLTQNMHTHAVLLFSTNTR